MKKYFFPSMLVVSISLALTTSCKKYADPPPYFEDDLDTTGAVVSRRVLLIGIDGAVSSEVKAIAPATITGMLAHAKFQWDGVSDEVSTDAASWKSLVTGISYAKHKIADSSFLFTPPEGNDSHGGIPPNYPSLFSYILSSGAKSNLRTTFISSWNTLLNRLVPEVQDPILTTNDQGVKDSAIARIKNKNQEFITLQFNGASIAGKAGGFTQANAGYKDAITRIDGYIGEIMTALRARPEYNKGEEWLIVIKNTHGGTGNSYGGSSPMETTSFTIFFNEKLKSYELTKSPYTSAMLTGRDGAAVNATVSSDGGLYDIGTGLQTIQLKVKGGNPGYYPHFMGKTAAFTQPGWTMFSSGGTWAFSIRSTTSSEKRIQAASGTVFDNSWHTITVVIYDSAGSRWVKRFTDNRRIADVDGTRNLPSNYGTITSASPLMLGWGGDKGYGPVTYNVADFKIFNTSMTDQEVLDNLCLTDITKHPKYSNLIGYWPCSDGFGSSFGNYAPGKGAYPLKLTGPFNWATEQLVPCNFIQPNVPPGNIQTLVSSGSIARTLFYWLRIPVQTSWGFEGADWLSNYESEFVPLY